jgi:hypothetical protein
VICLISKLVNKNKKKNKKNSFVGLMMSGRRSNCQTDTQIFKVWFNIYLRKHWTYLMKLLDYFRNVEALIYLLAYRRVYDTISGEA